MGETKPKPTKWLLGKLVASFSKSKLPRTIDVLKIIYFQQSQLKCTFNQSLQFVSDQVIEVWKSASIPTILRHRVVSKIRGFVINEYEAAKKNHRRKTDTQKVKEKNLKKKLNELFDISYHDIRNQQILNFLCDQRTTRKLKIDCVRSIDNNSGDTLAATNQQVEPTKSEVVIDQSVGNSSSNIELTDNETSEAEDSDDPDYKFHLRPVVTINRKKKFTKKSSVTNRIINSPDVLSALDRTKITNNEFLFIAAAIAKECNEDISKCTLSASSLYRRRNQNRANLAQIVKQEFTSAINGGLVVHWDGKKMADTTNPNRQLRKRKIERCGIVVSGAGVAKPKTLSVPKLENGSGKSFADAAFNAVKEWKTEQNVIGMSTDTTSSNTGNSNGACVLFEKQMKRNLLYLACRHHTHEVVIGGVFEELFGKSKSPENILFHQFQDVWPTIDKRKFNVIAPSFLKSTISKRLKNDTVTSLRKILAETDQTKYIPRGDYKELIELCLVILGENVPGFTFKLPGAFGNARWMTKVIYAFKMYLFRDQFSQAAGLEYQLREFCLFASLIYVKAWIECPISVDAAVNDLQLFKNLFEYSKLNKKVSDSAINKFDNHMWYLGSELVVFSLFSEKVPVQMKQKIINKIKHYDTEWTERGLRLESHENLQKKSLFDLFGYPSKSALYSLQIPAVEFMFNHNANTWNDSSVYSDV